MNLSEFLPLLLVDDHGPTLERVRAHLSAQYSVRTATSGMEALEILHSDPDIRVVVTDWMMPDIDGIELCRMARALERPNYLYLLVATSREEDEDLRVALEAGADAFIPKQQGLARLDSQLQVVQRGARLEHQLQAQLRKERASQKQLESLNSQLFENNLQLVEMKTRYQALFHSSAQAVAIFSLDGAYQEGNDLAESLWSLPALPDPNFLECFDHSDSFKRACAGESNFIEPFEYKTSSGSTVTLQIELRPLYSGPEVDAIVANIEDMTQAVIATGEHHRVLKEAQEDLGRANVALQEREMFFSILAHEMRNPLSGILGTIDLMRSPESVTPELLDQLGQCAASLSGLIDDTLDLERMGQKRLRLEEKPFDLNRMVKSVVDLHRHQADGRKLVLNLSQDDVGFITGDQLRTRQILSNLLSNAIKYTEAGSVGIVCSVEKGGASYRLKVTDTGVGISQHDIETVFDAYFQASREAKSSIKGVGLGLSIVKSLVNLMQGSIGVNSVLGQGTTFWVSLPLKKTDAATQQAEKLGRLRGRILIVDDNAINRRILELQLKGHGATVSLAENGKEALAVLQEQPFDIVLMDCHMPIMDGYETSRAIRADRQRYHDPIVIALSASASGNSRERCLEAGMTEFLCKPIRHLDLHAKLLAHLKDRPNASELALAAGNGTLP